MVSATQIPRCRSSRITINNVNELRNPGIFELVVDLVVNNAKVVTSEGIYEAGIAVEDGKITAIAKEPNLPKSDKGIDAKGLPVMPGDIDPHVHLGLYNPFGENVPESYKGQAIGGLTTTMHTILCHRPPKSG